MEEEGEEDNTIDWDYDISLVDIYLVDDNSRLDASHVSVARRILATPKVEGRRLACNTISQALIICGPKVKKLVIDGGSYINIV